MSTAALPDLGRAVELVRAGSRFLCVAHARLDGDAIGAMLVTAHGLRALGKEVGLWNQDPVPARLRFLPGAEDISRRPLQGKGLRYDATFVHDTGAPHLLGDRFPSPAITGPLVIIDHHGVASDFGDVSLRDPAAASAGVISWRLMEALGLEEARMDRKLAMALLVSLVEDTGWFRYPSTNPEALRLASACLQAGASPWDLALRLDESASPEGLRLLQLVLGTLERHCGGKLALLTLSDDLMRQAGATPDDVPKLVNYARGLRGVEIGALITLGDHDLYVSLRGKGAVDVAQIAARFGGGGHRGAAGCTIPAEGDEGRAAARALLVAAVGEALAEGPAPGAPPSASGAPRGGRP